MKATIHFSVERKNRAELLEELKAPILSINGKLCVFVVDKGHRNGKEIHVITENGIINIYNYNSKKYITGLIARPSQLIRYGVEIPEEIINKARFHTYMHYNEI